MIDRWRTLHVPRGMGCLWRLEDRAYAVREGLDPNYLRLEVTPESFALAAAEAERMRERHRLWLELIARTPMLKHPLFGVRTDLP